jgi:hypothetical protein
MCGYPMQVPCLPGCCTSLLLVACACAPPPVFARTQCLHDFEHRGVNNDFLVKSSDGLALLYNDRCVCVCERGVLGGLGGWRCWQGGAAACSPPPEPVSWPD